MSATLRLCPRCMTSAPCACSRRRIMSEHAVVIVAAKRTPIGAFQGVFASTSATELGAAAIRGALEASGVAAADVQEVIMGCVLPAGLGQAPARQAALGAGLPAGTPTTTVNKMC